MFIEDSIVEEIKNKVSIEEVIHPCVSLKSAGKNLKGLCPFHQEKTPSFFVNPVRQSFHCFGCGASGDIFSFIMKRENLSFPESVKKLAALCGVSIEPQKKNDPYEQKKNDLFQINEAAAEWFHHSLLMPGKGDFCQNYLKNRKINKETILVFKLGYAEDSWNTLTNHLISRGFSKTLILESGLALSKNETVYDRFRGRLMFPVFDSLGRITGFSGRILQTSEKSAKYVNSPETLIFKKNQLLYGLYQAKQSIREKGFVLMAEGHLDVCALHQHGFKQAVGSQGTAFTQEQAKLLSRYAKNIKVIYDGDQAGQNAALRLLPILLYQELNGEMVMLPPSDDPASLLAEGGPEPLKIVIEESISLFDFKIQTILKSHKNLSPQHKVAISEELIKDIRHVKNPVLKDTLIQQVAQSLKINPDSLYASLGKTQVQPIFTQTKKAFGLHTLPTQEKELLCLLLSFPEIHSSIFEHLDFEWLSHSNTQEIVDKIFHLYCEKKFSSENILTAFEEKPEQKKIIEYALKVSFSHPPTEVLDKLEMLHYQKILDQLQKKITNSPKSELPELLQEMNNLRKKRHEVSLKMNHGTDQEQ